MASNRERYAHRLDDQPAADSEVTVLTVGKHDETWSRARAFPSLEELTLHEPSTEQLAWAGSLKSVKRMRITHARPRTIEFIGTMSGIEELVLEYVSGFTDLAPLSALPALRALHMENLRGVSDFGGLAGAERLRYLAIYGTSDREQPISDLEFLRGLGELEVLALWQVKCRAPYPAMLPAVGLRNLKVLRIHRSYLATEEYALLEEGLGGVEGASWGPHGTVARSQIELPADDARARLTDESIRSLHPEVSLHYDGKRFIADPASRWFEFTGRGAGSVKCSSPNADAKCREKSTHYTLMKHQARALVDRVNGRPLEGHPVRTAES